MCCFKCGRGCSGLRLRKVASILSFEPSAGHFLDTPSCVDAASNLQDIVSYRLETRRTGALPPLWQRELGFKPLLRHVRRDAVSRPRAPCCPGRSGSPPWSPLALPRPPPPP